MAWEQSILEASFRGTTFDVVSTSDALERSLAEHSYPYVDGAEFEDLGANPRTLAMEAVFFGDDYETELQDLLAVLAEPGDGELIHPVFGSIEKAQLRRYGIEHQADDVDFCRLRMEFVEVRSSDPFFSRDLPSLQAAAIGAPGETGRLAVVGALSRLVDTLRANNPLAALDELRQAMLGPVVALAAEVSWVVTSGLDVLAYPRAWGNDLSILADAFFDLSGSSDSWMTGWRSVISNVTLFGDLFAQDQAATTPWLPGTSPTEAQAIAAVVATAAVTEATRVALAASDVLAAEATTATLSPVDIEEVCNAARTRLEAAIELCRTTFPLEVARAITEPLKTQALAVQTAAQAIIEARPPLLWRQLTITGNLRLLAHHWYGEHARAPELCRLNPKLRLPNALAAGDWIYGYRR